MKNQKDLGAFVSDLADATREEKYSWRMHPAHINSQDQLVLLGTLDNRDDYSVVEVATRKGYQRINKNYPADTVSLALSGANKEGDSIYRDIGVSMAVLQVVEIASLTFYRDRPLTPVHDMLADVTKVSITFPSPWGEWPDEISWSRLAYNYNNLVSPRQDNLTEDQQRRIEGLLLSMLHNRECAYHWLHSTQHSELSGLPGWAAVKKYGFNEIEKHICWIDRVDCDAGS